MTPSKAKEIIDRYGEYLVKEFKNEPSVDKWLATPQAAAILSGEDWKEDGKIGKIIEDLTFLRDKADDPIVKISYNMAITICKDHIQNERL